MGYASYISPAGQVTKNEKTEHTMFSSEDKAKFIEDLAWATDVQDGRAISRLALHGEDMGIIDGDTARKITALGGVIYQSTMKDGKFYADTLAALVAAL